jgi:hypothetical protein
MSEGKNRIMIFGPGTGGGKVGSAPCAISLPQPIGSTTGFVGM